ncbi:metal ABC transporter ATP-binding protein [Humisphaera borealis]|uniref:Metal ABC transporter ATP-binding protein n=1 Tax=Humisphaera borealis TaxID=2807512 RepID=A0A7M2WUI5_9BACT|nr:metal ABC transporter ATP-binding protein [Humisphaera borealis]QOV89156.1 metal ABC transporter ATP-binding protein [Humisphaera borealis]
MSELVSIRNLSFSYGSTVALENIDLSVLEGTTLGLIGPNGGGKSTLMKLMLGLLEPDAGEIRIGGLTPRKAVRRGDLIGYLPQRPHTPKNFPASVRQVVRMGLSGRAGLLHSPTTDDFAFVESLLTRVGLGDLADRPIGELSGGQLQRVYIARALAPRPKLLLLDEPTVGIDRGGQQRFIEFIQQLKVELGLTLVFVSHDLRAVTAIADRIACLSGTLHYHDVPDHLPAELVYRMFACDLEAMGIKGGHVCTHGAAETLVPIGVGSRVAS